MRVLVLNQWFPPDTAASAHMLGQLAEDLARSHDVHIVAGRPGYGVGGSDYSPHGPVAERVRSTSFDRRSLPGRFCNYMTFLALAPLAALRGSRPDIVVAMTDPPLVGLIGAAVATARRAPFVFICHDVYPDIAVAAGWVSSPVLIRVWGLVNRLIRNRADRIIVMGRDMAERLISQGVPEEKIVHLPTWADTQSLAPGAVQALRDRKGWGESFVVMHAGNVGLVQNVGILADLAERVESEPEIEIVVLGDGAGKPLLERAKRDRGLPNLTLLPAVPRRQAQELMAAADLHVVSLIPGLWGCAMPSKTYGIMAAGRPFVAVVDEGSEPARLAEELGCGVWVPAGDADALAAAVRALRAKPRDAMGNLGREAIAKRFARTRVTAEYARLLETLVDGVRQPSVMTTTRSRVISACESE